jgi:hypothetical protein
MKCSLIRMAWLGCAWALASAASAQPRTYTMDDINSRIWAKVANERAKANATKSGASAMELDRQCGSLEVGNVNTGGARSGGPREVTTIVLGDVLNIAGRCK